MSEHLAELRTALAQAIETYKPQATTFHLPLPGAEYELFPISQGSPVWWKSEPISQGKLVRFRAQGPCAIGLHYHDTAEVITAAEGVLFYTVGGATRALVQGETFTAQPHQIHSAEFKAPGEALAHWTDLEGDSIEISFFS